jgi:hypothetical protein
VGGIADHELGGDVENAVDVVGRGEELLPDLGLRALLENDPRPLVDERSALGLHGRQRDRFLEHDVASDRDGRGIAVDLHRDTLGQPAVL